MELRVRLGVLGGRVIVKIDFDTGIDAGSEKLSPTRSRLSIPLFDEFTTGSHEFSMRVRTRVGHSRTIGIRRFSGHRSAESVDASR